MYYNYLLHKQAEKAAVGASRGCLFQVKKICVTAVGYKAQRNLHMLHCSGDKCGDFINT